MSLEYVLSILTLSFEIASITLSVTKNIQQMICCNRLLTEISDLGRITVVSVVWIYPTFNPIILVLMS